MIRCLCGKVKERDMRLFFGWSKDSDTVCRYMHNDMSEVETKLDRINGVETKKQEEEFTNPFAPIRCVCGKENTPDKFVCVCGKTVLGEESLLKRQKADRVMDLLFEDEEFRNLVKKKLLQKT